MFYIKLKKGLCGDSGDPTQQTTLTYYCRRCQTEDDNIQETQTVFTNHDLNHEEKTFSHLVNDFIVYDPTFPRIKTVACPNPECPTASDAALAAKNEIVYLRYDDVRLKYLYICSTCKFKWKTDDTMASGQRLPPSTAVATVAAPVAASADASSATAAVDAIEPVSKRRGKKTEGKGAVSIKKTD
jgi:DNA-directed RNA polymerase subunit RPC12/RpoP